MKLRELVQKEHGADATYHVEIIPEQRFLKEGAFIELATLAEVERLLGRYAYVFLECETDADAEAILRERGDYTLVLGGSLKARLDSSSLTLNGLVQDGEKGCFWPFTCVLSLNV